MFILPDDLQQYKRKSAVYYYLHVNNAENNNSKLHFTTPCISIGINGTKRLQTTSGVEEFEAGDVIFYTPGNYLSYQNIDTEEPYRSMMIFFPTELFAQLASPFADSWKPCVPVHNTHYLSLKNDPYISCFLKSITHLHSQGKAFTVALQKVKLTELVIYLQGIFGSGFLDLAKRYPEDLNYLQLRRVIENDLNGNLTLEELAFMCNMSLATFKRAFNKIYAMSPGKWIRERRLAWAAEQITKLHRSPKVVSFEAGYENYSSFAYAFKQKYGVPPARMT